MVVMITSHKYKAGDVTKVKDNTGYNPVPCRIIREATFEEWLNQPGERVDPDDKYRAYNFYWVSVDC